MIATIEGRVTSLLDDRMIVELNGLGYEIVATSNTLNRLKNEQNVKVYIHEHIKEDAHDLYGFMSIEDKQLFERLLSVKNVGPRVAMVVLGIGSVDEVRQAIANGDIQLLQTAKGVGKRAAEQIVVELRDKVGLLVSQYAEDIVSRGSDIPDDDAVQALISLGYSVHDARMALGSIDQNLPIDERVKQALKSSAPAGKNK